MFVAILGGVGREMACLVCVCLGVLTSSHHPRSYPSRIDLIQANSNFSIWRGRPCIDGERTELESRKEGDVEEEDNNSLDLHPHLFHRVWKYCREKV